ncbi:hypothetical protein [Geobacillus thermoleovorans]|uniref:hypothetical protein n=1 Tax=Geobacillus thermoleovorans TaxID=33941 RepID=UPI003DA52D8A
MPPDATPSQGRRTKSVCTSGELQAPTSSVREVGVVDWLVTLFFSGTAVSLLSYQVFEIVQAIVDWIVDRHS